MNGAGRTALRDMSGLQGTERIGVKLATLIVFFGKMEGGAGSAPLLETLSLPERCLP